jgi:hypothetical protein
MAGGSPMNFCTPLFHPKYFPLLKNKYFEFQADKMQNSDYFRLSLRWTRKTHHAGPGFHFEFLGFCLFLNIYDNRHWNYEEEKWEECDTEEQQ